MNRWWIPLVIAESFVSQTAWAEMLTVNVDTANFREGPSTKHEILYTADKYYTVEVIEKKKDWVKTRDFEGDIAWVSAALLTQKNAVVVRVPCAIVRQGPSPQTPVVFKIDRGEGMMVSKQKGAWLSVTNVDGAKGWVHRDVVWGDGKR